VGLILVGMSWKRKRQSREQSPPRLASITRATVTTATGVLAYPAQRTPHRAANPAQQARQAQTMKTFYLDIS